MSLRDESPPNGLGPSSVISPLDQQVQEKLLIEDGSTAEKPARVNSGRIH